MNALGCYRTNCPCLSRGGASRPAQSAFVGLRKSPFLLERSAFKSRISNGMIGGFIADKWKAMWIVRADRPGALESAFKVTATTQRFFSRFYLTSHSLMDIMALFLSWLSGINETLGESLLGGSTVAILDLGRVGREASLVRVSA